MSAFVSPNQIRADFAAAMSDMYKQEVPAYGTLVSLVEQTNAQAIDQGNAFARKLEDNQGLARLNAERHGAIRLGSAFELSTMRRLFAVMGMEPVGYYDLSEAGIPVHSTAFRPVDLTDLNENPFRVFTSLLRLELIEDSQLRQTATEILAKRQIFQPQTLTLIEAYEIKGGLTAEQAADFIAAALETFRWHAQAPVSSELYNQLHDSHRLIADIVSFHGPHINHLTPRTLDIDLVQDTMPSRGINPKAVVEGPPARSCPILLRQTSFKALTEAVSFDDKVAGHHTARFGEIEQRGVALTPKGRGLYDACLTACRTEIKPAPDGSNAKDYQVALDRAFEDFPDTWEELYEQDLAYFKLAAKPGTPIPETKAGRLQAISDQSLELLPIIYEDFLPVSAAGIFQSNLGNKAQAESSISGNQQEFESALEAKVIDPFALYAAQADS